MTIVERVRLFLYARQPYAGKPRHVRMRQTLPEGYQFGDAAKPPVVQPTHDSGLQPFVALDYHAGEQ